MKPKDEKKLAAIALAAYRLVASRGLSAVTLADIAREAGIATSTLYVYYAAKEELLNALYEQAKTAAFGRYVEHDDGAAPVRARLRRIWLNMLENRLRHHAETVFIEQYYHSSFMSAANRALSARLAGHFTALLESGQRAEVLKPVALPFLLALILGSIKETAALLMAGAVPDDEASRATGFQLCWDAIKA
ncbi:MAG TPA: TetR family transcriptional regulator [Janthinobacterium sp.]|nr:TetR family transcriptional regulator [Janthinobacterium sp.]